MGELKKCEGCGKYEPVFSRPKGSSVVFCMRCLVKQTKQCVRCGEHVLFKDLVQDKGQGYCKSCVELLMEGLE